MNTPDEQLKYQIALTLMPGVGSVLAKNLVSYCGSIENIFKRKKSQLEKIPGIDEVAMHGNKLHLTVQDPVQATQQIYATGERMKLGVTSIREITPSLEDVFVSVMTRQRTE